MTLSPNGYLIGFTSTTCPCRKDQLLCTAAMRILTIKLHEYTRLLKGHNNILWKIKLNKDNTQIYHTLVLLIIQFPTTKKKGCSSILPQNASSLDSEHIKLNLKPYLKKKNEEMR